MSNIKAKGGWIATYRRKQSDSCIHIEVRKFDSHTEMTQQEAEAYALATRELQNLFGFIFIDLELLKFDRYQKFLEANSESEITEKYNS